ALTGTGTAAYTNSTITLGNHSTIGGTGTFTISGNITDGGATYNLIKAGTGTITLSNANTYDGTTTLNAGTLILNHANAIGSGNITINADSTLQLNNGINLTNSAIALN